VRRSPRWLPFLALAAAAPWAGCTLAQDKDAEPAQAEAAGMVFGPKLLSYAVECQEARACRIECFQNGVSVVLRSDIALGDEIRLVVNAGISDEVIPRWIEIRPVNGSSIQTILLTRDTLCDLKALTISVHGQK
jgi:hypothetical protein